MNHTLEVVEAVQRFLPFTREEHTIADEKEAYSGPCPFWPGLASGARHCKVTRFYVLGVDAVR